MNKKQHTECPICNKELNCNELKSGKSILRTFFACKNCTDHKYHSVLNEDSSVRYIVVEFQINNNKVIIQNNYHYNFSSVCVVNMLEYFNINEILKSNKMIDFDFPDLIEIKKKALLWLTFQ